MSVLVVVSMGGDLRGRTLRMTGLFALAGHFFYAGRFFCAGRGFCPGRVFVGWLSSLGGFSIWLVVLLHDTLRHSMAWHSIALALGLMIHWPNLHRHTAAQVSHYTRAPSRHLQFSIIDFVVSSFHDIKNFKIHKTHTTYVHVSWATTF